MVTFAASQSLCHVYRGCLAFYLLTEVTVGDISKAETSQEFRSVVKYSFVVHYHLGYLLRASTLLCTYACGYCGMDEAINANDSSEDNNNGNTFKKSFNHIQKSKANYRNCIKCFISYLHITYI